MNTAVKKILGLFWEQKRPGMTTKEQVEDNVKSLGWALVLVLFVHSFFFQPFNIPSGSMIPTLLIGDHLFVSKFSYGYTRYSFPFGSKIPYFEGRIMGAEPKLGQVAVFRPVGDESTDFIKRVIGVPGDQIQMRGGILYVNNVECPLEYVKEIDFYDDSGQTKKAALYTETLPNGQKHSVLKQREFGAGHYDSTPVYTVPEGHFFMMGDNRDGSDDSRGMGRVGFIPYDHFIGEAQMIFFSSGSHASLWQFWSWPFTAIYSRMFMMIH